MTLARSYMYIMSLLTRLIKHNLNPRSSELCPKGWGPSPKILYNAVWRNDCLFILQFEGLINRWNISFPIRFCGKETSWNSYFWLQHTVQGYLTLSYTLKSIVLASAHTAQPQRWSLTVRYPQKSIFLASVLTGRGPETAGTITENLTVRSEKKKNKSILQ